MKSINKKDLKAGEIYYRIDGDGDEYIVTYLKLKSYGPTLYKSRGKNEFDVYYTDQELDEESYEAKFYPVSDFHRQWLQNCVNADLHDCIEEIEEFKPKISDYEIY